MDTNSPDLPPNDDLLLDDARALRADAVKNRALLLSTAQRLFAEQGVSAVTMSAIAQAAGVGKGTLYRHFQSKAELCLTLLDEDQRALQTRALARLRQGGDPLDDLRWFLGEVARFVERNAPLLCVGLHDDNQATDSLNIPAHTWQRQTILGLLRRLDLPGDLDYLADSLYILVDVRTINFQRRAQGYSLDRILDGLDMAVLRLTST